MGVIVRTPEDTGNPSLDQLAAHRVQTPVAVVGFGCRLPGHNNNPQALWEFLTQGQVAENRPPASRFNLEGHFDGSRKPHTMVTPGGMWVEDVDPEVFDARFFNLSTADAVSMDPQQRQLLEVVYEALENAGLSLDAVSGEKIGCLVASMCGDYEVIQGRDPDEQVESTAPGISRSILSNRISHFLNITGPSMTIDTACSGSLTIVDVACRYLDANQSDGMIVAGVNLYLDPLHNEDVGLMRATASPSGRCHTFDAKADGYVRAEAVNCVVLKRLSDAIRDGDPVRAVIRGTASNNDGRTPGITHPSSSAQATAIRAAYVNAGIANLNDTAFLECHGTGTQAGDPIEVKGASSVFAPSRLEPLIIGSVKSNIGHSEAGAGISGLIKTVMALERGVIPGNPTFVTPNPKIDFVGSKVEVAQYTMKWPSNGMRRASVNSFGFGGSNAHAVVEAPDYLAPGVTNRYSRSYKEDDDDDYWDLGGDDMEGQKPTLLVLSANDEESLKQNIQALETHLVNPRVSVNLEDLAYTLSQRRSHHFHRAYTTTSSIDEISWSGFTLGKKKSSQLTIGMIFTGQGAQWPQMGRQLLETFPAAKAMIERLDKALATLPDAERPKWKLAGELTLPRSAEALRKPEFSQPLVTALQLAQLSVLETFGVKPATVVGHSSGEIAAAVAAGFLTPEDAIKIAYFRGFAPALVAQGSSEALGMLAVGIGEEQIQPYIDASSGVEIACYNSPSSLTLSGKMVELEKIEARLKADSHFARILQVDLAYHSKYMTEIGHGYKELLLSRCGEPLTGSPDVRWFSSVTGDLKTDVADAEYWRMNMLSSVRFSQASATMLQAKESPNMLIELGPSNALAGPVSQVIKSLPSSSRSSNVQYTSAAKRGPTSLQSLFDVAGQLYLAGFPVDLRRVNQYSPQPKFVVDLPNYQWNHSGARLWNEGPASKDWRFRKFIMHDLLGSKVIGTSWSSPSFTRLLRLADVPWLRDHKLGNQVVLPGTAYISMAIEAIFQTTMSTEWKMQQPDRYQYRLKDVKLVRGMVLEEDTDTRIMLSLSPTTRFTSPWYLFRIYSRQQDEQTTEHCNGLIRIDTTEPLPDVTATAAQMAPLQHPTPGALWYQACRDVGYMFGPSFQRMVNVESTPGSHASRTMVSMAYPEAPWKQSFYPMHPVCMDSCTQAFLPGLWKGDRANMNCVTIGTLIDSLTLNARPAQASEAVCLARVEHIAGRREGVAENYLGYCSLYDPTDGSLLLEISGFQLGRVEAQDDIATAHVYNRVLWNPDVSTLSTSLLRQHFAAASGKGATSEIQQVIDLVVHRIPTLKVLEVNQDAADTSCLFLQPQQQQELPPRDACSSYNFMSSDPQALIAVQDQYSHVPNTAFSLGDPSKAAPEGEKHDLIIAKLADEDPSTSILALRKAVEADGYVLLISDAEKCEEALASAGFHRVLSFTHDNNKRAYLAQPPCEHLAANGQAKGDKTITIVNFEQTPSPEAAQVEKALLAYGWQLAQASSTDDLQPQSIVLVLDELRNSVLSTSINNRQWDILQKLVEKECSLLWVTCGGQLDVSDPTKAAANGLLRVIRREEPHLRLINLDVAEPAGAATVEAINACLTQLVDSPGSKPAQKPTDSEFAERRGILHVSRVFPDAAVNRAKFELQDEGSSGGDKAVQTGPLFQNETTSRLAADRVGSLDHLSFREVASRPAPLGPNEVEVEVFASALNFKDVATTLGIVPSDEYRLGWECAGVIARVAPDVTCFKPGQRVAVYSQGSLANRVQVACEKVHIIPDSMSFDEAATIPVAFMTAMYALYDMAHLSRGQKVLIHSAAGGVGIAAVQLARRVGAEIYATVGTDEKRHFLQKTFDIPPSHIFDSRTRDFGQQILDLTHGAGVDVVLNSLTGELLEESWRITAAAGTLVDISKKDMMARNTLPMEPFMRNASYRALDTSHPTFTNAMIQAAISKTLQLISEGSLSPIAPVTTFGFDQIPDALRVMRGAKHMGKLVISRSVAADPEVSIRRAPRSFGFRADRSYLIVGGLKGLCGSIALSLAQNGARYLAVMSRSGHDDEKSQAIVAGVRALGCHVDLIKGDVSRADDVRRVFGETRVPVGGIIQGAMVLRDRPFTTMSSEEYRTAIDCKITGTWNLHNISQTLNLDLDFFTLLSSISGVVGQKGQANYAAGNAVLDAFASFRQSHGLPASSIALGAVEDIGYIAAQGNDLMTKVDGSAGGGNTLSHINERLLRKIVQLSLLQQVAAAPINPDSAAHLITGLAVPQPADSELRGDARMAGLFVRRQAAGGGGAGGSDANKGREMRELQLMLHSKAEPSAILASLIKVVCVYFGRTLRLGDDVDPERPLSAYGIDSMAAVEVRNWVRIEIGASLATFEITNAPSIVSLCEKILAKLVA